MKAWGDMSTNQQIEADQMVQISCLTIDQYLYSCSLKTTTPREKMKTVICLFLKLRFIN